MKNLFFAMFFVSFSVHALGYKEFQEKPNQFFGTDSNVSEKVLVTWETSKNVQKSCEKESKNRGLGGFDYKVEACSFWEDKNGVNACKIITGKKTTLATIGHELRHCYQGDWHK